MLISCAHQFVQADTARASEADMAAQHAVTGHSAYPAYCKLVLFPFDLQDESISVNSRTDSCVPLVSPAICVILL